MKSALRYSFKVENAGILPCNAERMSGSVFRGHSHRGGVENPQRKSRTQCRLALHARSKERASQLEQVFEILREPSVYSLRKFAEYDRKFIRLSQENLELKKAVAEIQQMLAEPQVPVLDDFDRWITSKEAQDFAGRLVAFVPGMGVIVAGDDMEEVMKAVGAHPLGSRAGIAMVPCQTVPI